ncbi:hypothetical protein F4779DRAFT_605906 [Xylariaceae sp. FL0662B]|nr:hypothetical protein F4779DRAFT_605906 [Xylariaceae sp. FL0662B]
MSSAPNEGRQSPPPERQTGAQLNDAPASGQGTDEAPNKKEAMQDQLQVRTHTIPYRTTPHPPSIHHPQGHPLANNNTQGLSSNPKGPLDDAVESKFTKTEKPSLEKV